MVHKNPLVTVIISSFNSSEFIKEALNSVLNQTWKEIELIVTDDCSSDSTVELCRSWINDHRSRFVRTDVVTSEVNTGVAGNANRGLRAARGEWIKFLGADDKLLPTCIEDSLTYVSVHQEARVLFSKVEVYENIFDPKHLIRTIPGNIHSSFNIMHSSMSAEAQYRKLLVSDRIHFSPSVFLYSETLRLIGGFDERIRFMEDYPLWLKLTKAGYKLHFLDKVTVMYRQHYGAQYNTNIDFLIKPNYFLTENFRQTYTYPYLPKSIELYQRFNWITNQIFRCRRLNNNRFCNQLLFSLLTIWLNPFRYFIFFQKKRINSKLNDYL